MCMLATAIFHSFSCHFMTENYKDSKLTLI